MRTSILALAVLIAACSSTPRVNVDPETGRADVDVEPVGQRSETWNATLASMGGSTVSGTASAMVSDDMTHGRITLSGPAGTYPWHIHEGECGDANGPIVGTMAAYPPVTVNAGGGTAQAHLADIELNEAKKYHVNVHASPTQMGTIVACGNLDD
jgi:hypothetical protein